MIRATGFDDSVLEAAPVAPRFSVVIPTRGRPSVRCAVNSVLAQSDPSFELIIVTDGDPGLADPHLSGVTDARIRRASQPATGVCAARNLGVSLASGTWVTFLDDDDEARPEWLATWASAIGPETAVVTATLAFHEGEATREVQCGLNPSDDTVGASKLLAAGFALTRDLFTAVGGYDERLTHSENLDLGLRLCDHLSASPSGAVRQVHHVVADVQVEQSRSRITRYGTATGEAAALLLERHAARFARDPDAEAGFQRILSRYRRLERNHRRSRRAAWRALRLDRKDPRSWKVAIAAHLPGLETPLLHALGSLQKRRRRKGDPT